MAKKIKDENGNTYKLKKPFYKRVWFWILVVIVIIAAGSAMGGNKGSDDKADKASSTKTTATNTKSSSSSKADSGKITLADFEAVANGTSYTDVVAKFGEPDALSESLIGGTKNVVAMYLIGVDGSLGANFNITFDNDAVTGKSQSDMK